MTILDDMLAHADLVSAVIENNDLQDKIRQAADDIAKSLATGHTLLVCGNGGSAADAQHFVAELVGRFETERDGYSAICLSSDPSIMTAISNDYGYVHSFKKQVRAHFGIANTLLAITTSGNSGNVQFAVQEALYNQMNVIVLSGKDGGRIHEDYKDRDDVMEIIIPSDNTARIQEMHGLILHCMAGEIDRLMMEG